jgi:hypothetical protein
VVLVLVRLLDNNVLLGVGGDFGSGFQLFQFIDCWVFAFDILVVSLDALIRAWFFFILSQQLHFDLLFR